MAYLCGNCGLAEMEFLCRTYKTTMFCNDLKGCELMQIQRACLHKSSPTFKSLVRKPTSSKTGGKSRYQCYLYCTQKKSYKKSVWKVLPYKEHTSWFTLLSIHLPCISTLARCTMKPLEIIDNDYEDRDVPFPWTWP